MSEVAAMGMSCGGLMTYGASGDKHITTIGIWNSGLLEPNAAIMFVGEHCSLCENTDWKVQQRGLK